MDQNKIVPSIWFKVDGGNIAKVIDYYKAIFNHNLKTGQIISLGETPSGKAEMCNISIFEKKYVFMSTDKEHHPLNDSISFMINCEDQNEIDTLWDYFTQEGKESQCGWCIDKYGLRWQVVPKNLGELMRKSNAFDVIMRQKKIIIEEY